MADMRQVRLHGPEDVRVDTVPVPDVPDDGVMVRIEAAGVCGSDAHMFRGVDPWGALNTLPATFGHESAGVVVERGRDVDGVDVGDRVAVVPMYSHWCLECDACRAGLTNACEVRGRWHGRQRGAAGFAEYEVVAARNVTPVGPRLSAELAALTDVYACALHALHRVPDGTRTVAVVGTGPIALSLAQVCRWAGLDVVVLGRDPERLAAIGSAGLADVTTAVSDPGTTVFDGGADVAFECVGGSSSDALGTAAAVVRKQGWIGVLGAFAGAAAIGYRDALKKELTVSFLNGYCSAGGSDFAESARLLDSGAVNAGALISDRFALDAFGDAIRTVVDRPVPGTMKVVVTP